MFLPIINGKNITLELLAKDDLFYWLDNKREAEILFGYRIDVEEIKGPLLFAFKKKIENMNKDPGNEIWYSYFTIIYKGRIIGTIGPKGKPDSDKQIEIGFGIAEKYRNKGMATEAVGLFCDWYFKNTEIDAILAETEKENIPSQKVLQKNAFRKVIEKDNNILWKRKR